ncbi:MAG: PHP domain-containing protein [Verrucomicrobiota bacterium]
MFTELHARSAFSFLHGASLPEDMVARAAALGYPAIAITDRLGFAGSARAHAAAREHGIRAIVGTVLEVPSSKDQVPNSPEVVALAANRHGYAQLCQHLGASRSSPYQERLAPIPATRREATHSPWNLELGTWNFDHGVIALTGDRDFQLSRLLLAGKTQQAETFTRQLIQRFGPENLHIQLTRHHLRDDPRLNRLLIELAHHLKLPVVASNAPLHATRADRLLCDAFTCLRHHTTLDQAGALLAPNGERHLKSPQQMHELFADLPEAISNTERLAERLEFTLENLGYEFPDAHDTTNQPLSLAEQATQLRRHTYHGAFKRYGTLSRKIKGQLEHELALIQKLGFQGYFLIVHDIMDFAKAHGIFCQGRGSAANSAVCYALGITNVDPVGGGLLFERFLSENRRSWPDIDIDFPSGDRRELVIQHVFEKYGPRGAAMTANVITYRPRSAFREMSKVLGFPPAIANRFSDIHASPRSGETENRGCPGPGQAVTDAARGSTPPPRGETAHSPNWTANFPVRQSLGEGGSSPHNPSPRGEAAHAPLFTSHSALGTPAQQATTNLFTAAGIPENHPRLPALLHLYHAVLTLPRHLGQHSGGMIICDRGLDHIVPLQPATMPGRTIVQWDKDDCEDLGIVKVDLLGLGMLAALEDSLALCQKRGHPVDPAHIPKDDPAVFDLLCRADTIGTFQVESRAQMATLPIMKPRTFYDLAIEVAIIRPGPIVGDLLHPYLNRRQGIHNVDYIHPSLEPILKRTLGVPLFQEQVLRMAMTLADFDGAEADELRRAMAFKRADEKMERISHKLRQRMSEKGVPAEAQDKVVKSIGSFALYGFPESHAISFALIAYLSCWMKAHRPAEFYCGLINNQPMGFYSVNTLIQDAKRHRVRTRPISVIHSRYETTILDDHHLRLGLHRLKGLKQTTAERIVEQGDQQPFQSLPDFLRRVKPNDKERRLLAASGALNDLPEVEHRRDALWQSELPLFEDELFSEVPSSKCQIPSNQATPPSEVRSSPFRGPLPPRREATHETQSSISNQQSSILPPMSPTECLATDLALTGATTGPHPMALWRAGLKPASQPRPPTTRSEAPQTPLHTDHSALGTGAKRPSLDTPPKAASELHHLPHGVPVTVGGMVICRQRPSTAKGHCFISLEDETGIANLFVPRDTFHENKLLITTEPFLLVEGRLQISEGGQPTVYTTAIHPLPGIDPGHAARSHDFH